MKALVMVMTGLGYVSTVGKHALATLIYTAMTSGEALKYNAQSSGLSAAFAC